MEGNEVDVHSAPALRLIIKKFRVDPCSPVSTPLPPGIFMDKSMAPKTDVEREYMSGILFLECNRSLLLSPNTSRADISCAVGLLHRYMENIGN